MRTFVQKPILTLFFCEKSWNCSCVHLCVCVCCVCSKALLDTHTDIFYSSLLKKLLKVMESSWPLLYQMGPTSFLTYLLTSFLSFFLSTPISCASRLYFNFWLVEIASLYTLMLFPFPPSTPLPSPFLAFLSHSPPPKGGHANCTFYHFWWLPNLSTYQVGFEINILPILLDFFLQPPNF